MAERGMLLAVIPFLNIDAGEHDDEPAELYAVAHAVSIACGGHAGDERSMRRVLEACKTHGTRIGAHPSYDDREGFGRRALEVDDEVLLDGLVRQLTALNAVADDVGVRPTHVKPHGALYHAADKSDLTARMLTLAMTSVSPYLRTLIGPPGGALQRAARRDGIRFVPEGFADRATLPDGSLVPRGEPGAVTTDLDAVRAQTRALVAQGKFETLCVHGDSPGALAIARAVRDVLDA